MTDNYDQLIQLRHELHSRPELAGGEVKTALTIAEILKRFKPTR